MTKGVVLLSLLLCINIVHNVATDSHYINEWAAEIHGGLEHARRVADDHGYEIVRNVRGFEDMYVLRHSEVPHRSKRSADHHTKRLALDKRVEWAEQQYLKKRSKRGYYDEKEKRESEDRIYREVAAKFNDPMLDDEWYLVDKRKNVQLPKVDLHVMPVWNKNITGKGVVVTILDDGLERTHDDLKANYDPKASGDLNDKDDDPMPRYDPTNENKHGTRCGGEVAMVANNHKCGVGIAFNANIGGVRMLDGEITDTLEGEAIGFKYDYIDIYSSSWGPNDDGHTVEGPGALARAAFERGVTMGRNGKGVLYVWASGNGGRLQDNCDCDGYTGSIYTISISSASEEFKKPWYGERCASTMATTYSSGSLMDRKVVSTDLHNKCTDAHTGTSAAAPMAAGIFALLLEANPNLTWRDVQHLIAWTSQPYPLMKDKNWQKNGANFWVNNGFGFGILDAAGLIDAAHPQVWRQVPEKFVCEIRSSAISNLPLKLDSRDGSAKLLIHTSGCEGEENEIKYLEHVIVTLTSTYTKRGDLGLYLMSPSGTKTMLLSHRGLDTTSTGFKKWPLMSVHTWMENPKGTWTLYFDDKSNNGNTGAVIDVSLTLHGMKELPHYMAGGPRQYNVNYNMVKNEKKEEEDSGGSPSNLQELLLKKAKIEFLEKILAG